MLFTKVLDENEKCFLFFGRPAVNKGIFVLEEAIKKLNKKSNTVPVAVIFLKMTFATSVKTCAGINPLFAL